MSSSIEQIRSCLVATFAPLECELEDESQYHVGHAGAASGGGHYKLTIVSSKFEGISRIQRHRLVYDCLRHMMLTDIHALAITAVAPSELNDSGEPATR
jgi:BolA protein